MSEALLAGLRVVEIAHPLTEYAGLVLAGLGAEVFLVEPPEGSPTRRRQPRVPGAGESERGSIAFLARNTSKVSVVIDPESREDARLLGDLCRRADLVLDVADGACHELVSVAAPQVRVTLRDRDGLGVSSIVGFAASGGLASSGWPHRPPCNAPSWLALDGASIYAACAGLIGVLAARRGAGRVRYEVPYREAAVAAITPWTRPLHAYGMEATGQGVKTSRLGPGGFPIYEAKDGYVRVLVATPKQWAAFVALMGSPEDLVAGPWKDPVFRSENADALQMMCSEITRTRTVATLFHEGQDLGLTITPVYTLNGFREDAHVRGRDILLPVTDPEFGPMELVRPPVLVRQGGSNVAVSPAPALGDGQGRARAVAAEPAPEALPEGLIDPARPLEGLRVLELGVGAVVPESASLLALFGAEVIKIESQVRLDFLRQRGLNGVGDFNNAPTFNQMNLGVKSFAVDMSRPEGADLARRLVARCDVLMENMRGGVVEQWELDFESARRLRPDLIYLSSQGLGRGLYDGYQTYGPNLQTFSGVTGQWAHPDDPFPVGTTLNHPDHMAGKQALVPLLAALLRRDETGAGAWIEAAQVETASYLIGDRFLEQFYADDDLAPLGNRSRDMAPHGCYPCAGDDRWIAVAVETDEQWRRLCEVLRRGGDAVWAEAPELSRREQRVAGAATIDAAFGEWTRSRSPEEVETLLRSAGVPVSRVVTGDDVAADAGGHASAFFPSLAHPTAGTRCYTGVPVLLNGDRRPAARRPPLLGEHTEYVLHDLLGLDAGQIDRLMAAKAVGY